MLGSGDGHCPDSGENTDEGSGEEVSGDAVKGGNYYYFDSIPPDYHSQIFNSIGANDLARRRNDLGAMAQGEMQNVVKKIKGKLALFR